MNGNLDHPKEMIFHLATGVTDIPSLFLPPNLYLTLSHCQSHIYFLSLYFYNIERERPKQDDLYTKKLSVKEFIYNSAHCSFHLISISHT